VNQSAVLRYCYNTVFEILKKESEKSHLFNVAERMFDDKKPEQTTVFLGVSDIAQITQDKNGEKVFINEQEYPAPTYIAFILTINITSEQYQDVLETVGYFVRYFKDNNTFGADEYNWHGNTSNLIYMEPVIREPEMNRMLNNQSSPVVRLEYRVEAAINSERGGVFKRVQTRDIRGKQVK
jgi:hypothetical protein